MGDRTGPASIAGCTSDATGSACEEEVIVDVFETYLAGESYTWRIEMERDADLEVTAVQTGDGARPTLEVEGPDGNTIASVGPSETIRRTVTASTDGNHYVRVVNEAVMTSGQWDVTITARSEGC